MTDPTPSGDVDSEKPSETSIPQDGTTELGGIPDVQSDTVENVNEPSMPPPISHGVSHSRYPSQSLGHGFSHTRRLSDISRQIVDDNIALSRFDASIVAEAPEFLKGNPYLLQLWALKKECAIQVEAIVFSPDGIRERFGFQQGVTGGTQAAIEGLVADLTGGGGEKVPTTEEAIVTLHGAIFENYNRWALMVGGRPVHTEYLAKKGLLPTDSLKTVNTHTIPSENPVELTPSIGEGSPGNQSGKIEVAEDAIEEKEVQFGEANVVGEAAGEVDTQELDNLQIENPNPDVTGFDEMNYGQEGIYLPDGSDPATKLYELALYYCIRAESANLRFMPELLCWLFHQMRNDYRPPSIEAVVEHEADLESSFFHRTTVIPLYEILKREAKQTRKASPGLLSAIIPCCKRTGNTEFVRNSERPNYDDFNEMFWKSDCLSWGYHDLDDEMGISKCIHRIPKTFNEKSTWTAVLLSYWRWFAFQAVLFHCLFLLGWEIVRLDGINVVGIINVPVMEMVYAVAGGAETLGYTHFILLLLVGAHAVPSSTTATGGKNRLLVSLQQVGFKGVIKTIYAVAWLGVLVVVTNSKSLLGTDMAKSMVMVAIVGARLLCIALAEGILAPCGMRHSNPLRKFFSEMEHIQNVSMSGPQHSTVLGKSHMTEPFYRVLKYSIFWTFLLIVKVVFDLHIITQQVRLVRTLQETALNYSLPFQFSVFGYQHGLIILGSWLTIFFLCLVDSHIFFMLGAPVVGYVVCAKDGLGSLTRASSSDVKSAFIKGLPILGPGGFRLRGAPLALQFVRKCVPLAERRGVDPNTIFRRVWDQLVMSLRELDLISNEEQCLLMYGDGVLGIVNQLPLFMYAGKLKKLFKRIGKIRILAESLGSDEEFVKAACGSTGAKEALEEIAEALPVIISIVCQSHMSIGYTDRHLAKTLQQTFNPTGKGIRECFLAIARVRSKPTDSFRELGVLIVKFLIEFEKESASTRLRGSPLLRATFDLLSFMYKVWEGVDPPISVTAVDNLSFAAPTLEALALAAAYNTTNVVVPSAVETGGEEAIEEGEEPVDPSSSSSYYQTSNLNSQPDSTQMSTRSLLGLLQLLRLPNEGRGNLDADGDPDTVEMLEALRECARRAFYLLTMDSSDGELTVPEAERRVQWFINSMYMSQMPSSASVLHLPAFSVLTPQYNEAVVYGRRNFLSQVNDAGVSPMLYLKSMHPHEWSNFTERLGVKGETQAWLAEKDATGAPCSGELETRLWASFRGQTLVRTVHGIMQYARAIRLLATIQLELEFSDQLAGAYLGQGVDDQNDMSAIAYEAQNSLVTDEAANNSADENRNGNSENVTPAVQDQNTPQESTYALPMMSMGGVGTLDPASSSNFDTNNSNNSNNGAASSSTQSNPSPGGTTNSNTANKTTGYNPNGVVGMTPNAEQIETHAAEAAVWFTAERFGYVCACQRYSEHLEDDVRRRADIDYLLLIHPLLQVAYFESSISGYTGKRRIMSVCKSGLGIRFRIPCPGNAIVDGIGEGKPENQMNAAPYVGGHYVQAIDMNQDGYLEEALKVPNALLCLREKKSSNRKVVVLGLREHIFTHSLSASAYFMSQQEYLFGTMWQRVMASPLRVRMHYGHPDFFSKIFTMTRGGTSKASAVVNVSEDIFAGFNCLLRGGESDHVEFMQVGKGRDVGMLQIQVFESKISGGTGMSITTRDSFRITEGMDFARLLSFYHSGGGFYTYNVFIVCSLIATVYYMTSMAITEADYAILASEYVYLVGDLTFVQWFLQLGLLSLIPLFFLYMLETGIITAFKRIIHSFTMLSPLFFMFEIQTKAYYFDAALTFGRQGYLGTGRDFVLRHLSFSENFRGTAYSHLYIGGEVFLLLILISVFGTFTSMTTYFFFFATGWLFTISLLFAPFWFNPLAFEWRSVKEDVTGFIRWLKGTASSGAHSHGGGNAIANPESSWEEWYKRDVLSPYLSASRMARFFRIIRISRLLLPVSLLVHRMGGVKGADLFVLALFVSFPFAILLGMEIIHSTLHAITCKSTTSTVNGQRKANNPFCVATERFILVLLGAAGMAGGGVLLGLAFFSFDFLSLVACACAGLLSFVWATRIALIVNVRPLQNGTRAAHKAIDAAMGFFLLMIQGGLSLFCPIGHTLHSRMLFSSRYGDTVDVVTGRRGALEKMHGGKFLKFSGLEDLEFGKENNENEEEVQDKDSGIKLIINHLNGNGNGGNTNVNGTVGEESKDVGLRARFSRRKGGVAAADGPNDLSFGGMALENKIGVRRFRLRRVDIGLIGASMNKEDNPAAKGSPGGAVSGAGSAGTGVSVAVTVEDPSQVEALPSMNMGGMNMGGMNMGGMNMGGMNMGGVGLDVGMGTGSSNSGSTSSNSNTKKSVAEILNKARDDAKAAQEKEEAMRSGRPTDKEKEKEKKKKKKKKKHDEEKSKKKESKKPKWPPS